MIPPPKKTKKNRYLVWNNNVSDSYIICVRVVHEDCALYTVFWFVYISVKLAGQWSVQHCGSLMKLSLRLSFTAGWRYWTVRRVWAGRWSSPAAQLHPTSLPSLYHTMLGFASPRLPSNLASRSAPLPGNGGLNHNTSSWAAHPPVLIPPSSVSLIPFFTPEKSALLLLHSILYLAVNPSSASLLKQGLPTYSPFMFLSFCLYHSP